MSVRHALLALLSEGPKYGLQLRQEFEARTGEVWPLNVGQVYTTVQRLERDGLVVSGDGEEPGPQKSYRITEAGGEELRTWLATPPAADVPPRDELTIKVLVALRVPGVRVASILQAHRRHLIENMRRYTLLKEEAAPDDVGLLLVADAELFRLESVVRWLDSAEARLRHLAPAEPTASAEPTTSEPTTSEAMEKDGPVSPVLELRDITKVYGSGPAEVLALAGVNLTVRAGEMVAVMGPSGSGKSTLLTIAGSLERPTGGQVLVEGIPLAGMSRNEQARMRRRHVGYVFQDSNLLPGLTATENIALPLELDGVKAGRAAEAARRALEQVGLADQAGRYPDELSGGQRQRVAIARAMVGERRLLLADEPSGALDTRTGETVIRLLRGACKQGAAALLATHDAQLAAWADRVVFVRDGVAIDETAPPAGPESLLAGS